MDKKHIVHGADGKIYQIARRPGGNQIELVELSPGNKYYDTAKSLLEAGITEAPAVEIANVSDPTLAISDEQMSLTSFSSLPTRQDDD